MVTRPASASWQLAAKNRSKPSTSALRSASVGWGTLAGGMLRPRRYWIIFSSKGALATRASGS